MTTKTKKKRIRRTPEYFDNEVSELTNGEYVPMSPFVKISEKVEMLHKSCGNVYEVTPDKFLRGRRCPRCANEARSNSQSGTTEEYTQRVETLTDGHYVIQGEYRDSRTKIPMLHTVCGNTWEVRPDVFLMGRRCPHCANEARRGTTEEFTKKVDTLTNGEYVVKGEYEGALKKIPMLHTFCGNIYEVRPNEFLNGSRCPNCRSSKGEKSIADALDALSIEYIREHSFGWLGRYRYDFWLPNERIAIEYDGFQHHNAVSYFGGDAALERTRQSDALKDAFCIAENIDLLRIPYWRFDNVDSIVQEFIEDTRTFNELFSQNNEKETVL